MPDLQFVWPKDGPRGRSGHRGLFGRLNNVLTGRGPDVFLQRKGDRTPITPQVWGNWDSYHNIMCHWNEAGYVNKPWCASRGLKRYDPHTRRYRNWATPQDWFGYGVGGYGVDEHGLGVTRFTTEEFNRIRRRLRRGRQLDPLNMGKEWNSVGPKRFRTDHDWFWQQAHQQGENRRENIPPGAGPNPNMFMSWQLGPGADLDEWIRREVV